MPNSHFTEEFKAEVIKQITEPGYSVAAVLTSWNGTKSR